MNGHIICKTNKKGSCISSFPVLLLLNYFSDLILLTKDFNIILVYIVTFKNQHLLSRAPVSDSDPRFNKRPKRKWNREIHNSQVLEVVEAMAGATRRQGSVYAKNTAGHGSCAIIRVLRVLWGTWAKARLVSSNQKDGGFDKFRGGLI